MNRNALKYLINISLFVDTCAVTLVGLLLAFVVPRGPAPPGERVFWGLHRHQWADIHLYLSLLLVALVVVHLWLAWPWVCKLSRRMFGDAWKKRLVQLSLAWIPLLLLCWLLARL